MGWLTGSYKNGSKKVPTASPEELVATLVTEHDHLYWISWVITGDPTLAKKCLVDASRLSINRTGVFRDWLATWSRYATARIAISSIRDDIAVAVSRYESMSCGHANHDLLSRPEIESIRQLDPALLVADLDPVSRAILVLRGCQGVSIADCALLLQISPKCVIGAYCTALRWVSQRSLVPSDCGNFAESIVGNHQCR